MNKICIVHKNHSSNLALSSAGARQVSFLEVWGDKPDVQQSVDSLEALLQAQKQSTDEIESTPRDGLKSILTNIGSLLG